MSLHIVQEYLKPYAKDSQIIELSQSSATVELAAQALGIQEERIAKTLSLWVKDQDKAQNAESGRSGTIYQSHHRRCLSFRYTENHRHLF